MATTKKLDPFGGGNAINSGTVQTGGGRIYTAGEPQYRTVTARNVPLVYATEPAKPMVERWGSPEWKAAHGTAGATQIQAAQTPLNQAAQSSFTPQTASAGASSASAANANTAYPYYVGASFTNTQPIDYQPPEKPTYTEPYDVPGMRQAYMDAVNQGFSYDKRPDYDMYYGSQYDSMINDLTNRQAFSYDPNTDPVYQAYKKQYAREGQRATQDTMASAASMTGGVPSSYAVSAAQQAGNYYAAQMSDKLPELYNQAYNRYLQEYQNQISALSAVNNAERLRHDVWLGNIDNYWKGVGMDYDIHRDAVNDAYNALNAERNISNDAYGRYIDELNQYNTDNKFGYGQTIDQMNYEQGNENTAYQRAEAEEEQARLRQQEELERAITLAELGDMSALQALGVDTSYYEALQQAKLADQQAQTTARLMRSSGSSGSSGGSRSSGSGGSDDTLILDDGAPLESEEETSEEAPVTEGTSMEESINLRISSIADNAKANGGIVAMPVDWQYLLQYFDEDTLHGRGIFKSVADRNSYMSGVRAAAEAQAEADRNLVDSRGNRTYTSGANDGGSVAETKAKSANNNPNAVRTADISVISHSGSNGSFVDTYEAARDAMKRDSVPDNVATGLLTESQWNKKKEAAKNSKSVAVTRGNMTYIDDPVGGALSYGTYKEYLQAYTSWAQGRYGKSGR